jgi:Holliday junction resolvase
LSKTTTARAQKHENYIAKMYKGRRSPSSGASWSDRGDVRFDIENYKFTAECKTTEKKSFSIKKDTWNKIVEEAQEQDRRPCMFVRFEDESGNTIDLIVKSIHDDLEMVEDVRH